MENTPKTLERENPSLLTSSKSNITSNCVENPSTPKPMSISETNGCPTTFIQADTNNFKQVVQMLTGSPETTKQASKPASPAKTGPKKLGFKLHERRNSLKNLKMIIPGLALDSVLSPSQSKILSPSVLDLHKLVLSPKTPLNSSLEEKSIAEKGFYLLGSPVTTPRGSEPQLLPLFPVTSPRVSGTS
ncbi:VQ motif-containing protein [Actinidia chinensis var. chinensis]|uniref:VQ motif-containing protein n=1 Tax=Actinidia chinensis var. chinensis TaxID=1590841 RepID=A0A2R6QXC8_ACTCC|nr:VQ motif-containing protein [Actinidia chinensis var. chinensis]